MQMFTVKMSEGILATAYKDGDKFYIDPYKLLPLERFLPQPKGAGAHLALAPLRACLLVCLHCHLRCAAC